MVKVVYKGGQQEVWVPAVDKVFVLGEPLEVSEEEAEVLLSNSDFEKLATSKKKEEGEN